MSVAAEEGTATAVTVTVWAVVAPLAVVTVIAAWPVATALTRPDALTVATVRRFKALTVATVRRFDACATATTLLLALAGLTVAASWLVCVG